jgi:acyl-CoA synthetase (AMP-forming)/AMP-acid ligase II
MIPLASSDRIALVDLRSVGVGDRWTWADLVAAVRLEQAELIDGPQIVFLDQARSIPWVVRLIAALDLRLTVVPVKAGTTPAERLRMAEVMSADGDETRLEDGGVVLFTSGSVADPKAVALSTQALLASAKRTIDSYEINPATRMLSVLELGHGHGLVVTVLAPLLAGGCVLLADRFGAFSLASFWAHLNEATHVSLVPSIGHALLQVGPPRVKPKALKVITMASAPLSPKLRDDLEALTGVKVANNYGMTETATWVARSGLDGGPRGTVGKADRSALRIDEDTGEIQVKGQQLCIGYVGSPQGFSKTMKGQWFCTGDKGRFDKDGWLYLVGRLKNIISIGGEKVYPQEVVEVLLADLSVEDAVVFGIADPRYGEAVVAVVCPAHIDTQALMGRVGPKLSAYKRPSKVYTLDSLHFGPTGKVDIGAIKGAVGCE